MSELTLLVLRLGFLAVLWLFVFSVMWSLRSDLFGAPVRRMKASMSDAPAPEPQNIQATAQRAPKPTLNNAPAKELVILSGVASGSTIPLDTNVVTIGRSPDSTLVIVDEYTSTYHAKLERTGSDWIITDLDSTNGTKVAGKRITNSVPLPTFTEVTIGTTSFELRP